MLHYEVSNLSRRIEVEHWQGCDNRVIGRKRDDVGVVREDGRLADALAADFDARHVPFAFESLDDHKVARGKLRQQFI